MRKFVISDIHGGYRALIQVLKASEFDYDKDQLICLGDTADGWVDGALCFDELLKIKNLTYIMGNHDDWLRSYLKFGLTPGIWTSQGGFASIESYAGNSELIQKHLELLENAPYYHEQDGCLFVHGGFDWHFPIKDQEPYSLIWDRYLYLAARWWQKQIDNGISDDKYRVNDYFEVFIGHTSTSFNYPDLKPVKLSNVWCLDQGCGWEGKLTLMDIETKEYWQSDIVKNLYPEAKGR